MIQRLNAALEGRYRIERELGEGGMATVYLADDLRHERKVALKVLKPELAAVVGVERFLVEIRTTASLQHPHILPLFDSGEAAGFLFYVMPYVEGESLRDRLARERQLPIEEALRIVADIAEALDSAHRHGVVHRDIKPANILLHEGRPLVADFGIALAVQQAGGGRLTETGLSLGTPHYMSPEQATAERDADARSDVHSLGSVLYECLTGEPPFAGGSAQAVLGKILTSDARPPSELRRSIPSHVEGAALKALERLPADRFALAAEFGRALQDSSFRHRTPAVGGAVEGGRSRALVGTPGVIAVVTSALAVWGWFRGHEEPKDVTRFALPDVSPEGRWMAYVSTETGREEVYVRPFMAPGGRFAISTDGGDMPLWVSSTELVYIAEGPRLMLATVEDGRLVGQRSLFSVAGYDTFGNVPPYDVSPDGEEFLFVRSGGTTSPIVVLNWLSEVERLLEGGS